MMLEILLLVSLTDLNLKTTWLLRRRTVDVYGGGLYRIISILG